MKSKISEQLQTLEVLLNQAPCGIGIYDISTSLPVFLNDSYYNIIGYTREEYAPIMANSEALMFSTDISISQNAQAKFAERGAGEGYKYRIVRKTERSAGLS
ncbi:MAG: hypothetical protein PHP50_13070 [Lachnospiraceae bacterium]|nr:hypothetical protein [Lachnospiraceae bacterium]